MKITIYSERDVVRLAEAQRAAIYGLLGCLAYCSFIAAVFREVPVLPSSRSWLDLLTLGAGLYVYYTYGKAFYRLSQALSGSGSVVLAVAACLPWLGLILTGWKVREATRVLELHGLQVGLVGVSKESVTLWLKSRSAN